MTLSSNFCFGWQSSLILNCHSVVVGVRILENRWLVELSANLLRSHIIVYGLCLSHIAVVLDRILLSLVALLYSTATVLSGGISQWHGLHWIIILGLNVPAVSLLIMLRNVLDTFSTVVEPDLILNLVWRQTLLRISH